jgi:hypothetical protein
MVRAVLSLSPDDFRNSSFAPRMSPWVASYVQGLKGTEVPPLMNIVFARPPTKLVSNGKPIEVPAAPPGLFEIRLLFGDWSDQVFKWVHDESMPRHVRREWSALN